MHSRSTIGTVRGLAGSVCSFQPRVAAVRCDRRHRCRAVVTTAMLGLNTVETIKIASQIASTVTLAVGAWWLLGREALMDEDVMDETHSQTPCPSCHGTGYEPCMCTRWSDNDIGCGACRKTGYMKCRSCGGGGTAVPIAVAVRK